MSPPAEDAQSPRSTEEGQSEATLSDDEKRPSDPLFDEGETAAASQPVTPRNRVSVGVSSPSPRVVAAMMLVWGATVLGYAHVSGFSVEFVFIGLFTGYVLLLELAPVDRAGQHWRRLARLVLVVGYAVCAVLILSRLPPAVTAVGEEVVAGYATLVGHTV